MKLPFYRKRYWASYYDRVCEVYKDNEFFFRIWAMPRSLPWTNICRIRLPKSTGFQSNSTVTSLPNMTCKREMPRPCLLQTTASMWSATHCYPSRRRFFAEVARVLRPGGLFLFADLALCAPCRLSMDGLTLAR
jgi:SAM-dependent methyltransferase